MPSSTLPQGSQFAREPTVGQPRPGPSRPPPVLALIDVRAISRDAASRTAQLSDDTSLQDVPYEDTCNECVRRPSLSERARASMAVTGRQAQLIVVRVGARERLIGPIRSKRMR